MTYPHDTAWTYKVKKYAERKKSLCMHLDV